MKCVNLHYLPLKLCVYNDELWVDGASKGIFVCNLQLEQIKHIKHPHFSQAASVVKTPTGVIVCDNNAGLHHLNHQGDYTNRICVGHFGDASLTSDNKIYALNYKQGEIHTFVSYQNSWVKDTQFQLVEYSKGCHRDKLCTTSTHLYVSSWSNHCILVYTLRGKYVYKTGGYGEEVGQFKTPLLTDVDSEGKLLVCDWGNNRLQVFNTLNRVWSELSGFDRVEHPGGAGVGDKHLWVGTGVHGRNKLIKFEVI